MDEFHFKGKLRDAGQSASGESRLRRQRRFLFHLAPPRSWLSRSVRCGGGGETAGERCANRLPTPGLVPAGPVHVHRRGIAGGAPHLSPEPNEAAPVPRACLPGGGRETNSWGSIARKSG